MTTSRVELMDVKRPVRIALIIGVAAAVIAIAGLLISGPALFFQAYLYAFLFWLGISLGSMAILFLHFTVSSRWGLTVRRITEASAGSVWVSGILFFPLLFGLRYLYPWADPAKVAASALLQYKSWYLNLPFFILRAVIYFAVWILITFLINRRSAALARDPAGDQTIKGRLQGVSAFCLVIYAITMTFAAVDWLMSLDTGWVSTAFGLIIIMSQVLTGLAFAVLILHLIPSLSLGRKWTYLTTPVPYQDLGALMLTFVMGWAYVTFFQMLIQWGGNEPGEVEWFLARLNGGWNIVVILIAVLEFVLPFCILLSIRARHNLRILAWMGGLLMFIFLVNMFWHVKPSFYPGQFSISWLDIVMPFALGGFWVAGFLFTLQRRPPIPLPDQELITVPGNVEKPVAYVKE